ncbi:hypothetical protein EJ04DRAFT_53999 [Polyplosphaeria fusca]|uniref:Secreted protein n=1 Tax=Polyplosphaeria fusca TaxID=682080 RepID=A0A9P4QP58_9PLEO|nr:hypothetical protein EJ04DRAFT_53999 [Polyplosphaeria fusca]
MWWWWWWWWCLVRPTRQVGGGFCARGSLHRERANGNGSCQCKSARKARRTQIRHLTVCQLPTEGKCWCETSPAKPQWVHSHRTGFAVASLGSQPRPPSLHPRPLSPRHFAPAACTCPCPAAANCSSAVVSRNMLIMGKRPSPCPSK